MKTIAKFYTLFWILYFPLCIAFYDLVHEYVDEVMTLVLLLYTLPKIHKNYVNNEPLKELRYCVVIFIFYLVYSLIRIVNVVPAILIDFQQQIRPYIVFYCTLILAPSFSKKQKKWMLLSVIGSLVGFLIYNSKLVFTSELVVFGSLSICSGMTYYLFTEPNKRNLYIATAIVLFGLLCGKFKYIGECVAFIGVVFFLKNKVRIGSPKSIMLISILAATAIYFAWERFDSYFVNGMNNKQLARPMMYKAAGKILVDYFPFGSGLGTFGTSASAKTYYSPLYYQYELNTIWGLSKADRGAFNADSFYPCLAQYGVVGIFFFLLFWKRQLSAINDIEDMRYYKIAIMTFLCLAVENMGDTSYLSGRGMVYFFLMAICMNSNRYREII